MSVFRTKPLSKLLAQAVDNEHGLKRTLTAQGLIALGIGAIIGAGLFVRTAAASAEAAGPGVIVSFLIAAVGCAFAGICYAEFASMIPIAGSAYTYSYVTMGEFVAWVIGWSLILEYALGATTVAIAWSEYLNNLTGGAIPYQWCHSILQTSPDGVRGIVNAPALLILLIITLVLIKGIQESAFLNSIIVLVKVAIVIAFIAIGWQFINPANHTPFLIPAGTPGHEGTFQHGWGGVLGGASIVFFAFIGFDAVSTAAQETKNPGRDMPIGILGSLALCTVLYVLFGYVITGVGSWREFLTAGKEASVVYAIQHHMPGYGWLATLVTVAILFGFSSVILVMLLGQSRVFFSMSIDGLIPSVFSDLHPTCRTPYKSNIILFLFVGVLAGFLPGDITGDLTSIGTLFAFVLVSLGVWIMRRKQPDIPRPFRTPMVPLIPILGMLICGLMIVSLKHQSQIVAFLWMLIGLGVYFSYGRRHSILNNPELDQSKRLETVKP